MSKLVFVSHIHEEKDIALLIKKLVEDSFLGMIEVFVSSDAESNAMGSRWLDNISLALKNCSIEIILCSSNSVARPWINFEAGAGWVRQIPVIPICHSGLTPSKLPLPLNLLNAVIASDVESMKKIFLVMATALGSKTPIVDLTDFIEKVRGFEQKYTFWDACNKSFSKLVNRFGNNGAKFMDLLRQTPYAEIADLPAEWLPEIREAMTFLSQHRILTFSGPLAGATGPTGTTHLCRFTPGDRFREVLADPRFKV